MKKNPLFTIKYRYVLILFLLLVAIRAIYYSASEGFSMPRINYKSPKQITLPAPTEAEINELKQITNQEFFYLAKGSQAYAFLSQDGHYILKLFKFYHFRPIPFFENVLNKDSHTILGEHFNRRHKKRDLTLESYRIAFSDLAKECGIYYLQISPSVQYHLPVTVVDKIGRKYHLNLEQYGYTLQKRAYLIYPTLQHWIKKNDMVSAKTFLHNLVQLIVRREQLGIQDQDPDLHKNAGVIGTEALFIDIGSFHYNAKAKENDVCVTDLKKTTAALKKWLEQHSPELALFLNSEIENLIL